MYLSVFEVAGSAASEEQVTNNQLQKLLASKTDELEGLEAGAEMHAAELQAELERLQIASGSEASEERARSEELQKLLAAKTGESSRLEGDAATLGDTIAQLQAELKDLQVSFAFARQFVVGWCILLVSQ